MGRYGAGTENEKGRMVVDFAKRMDLAVVNTYFKKKDKQSMTYKSGKKRTKKLNHFYSCIDCNPEENLQKKFGRQGVKG